MTYIVVKNVNYEKFLDECNEMIQRRFSPCGGVSVNMIEDQTIGRHYLYAQAFIGEV
jgi:hypothetical protein